MGIVEMLVIHLLDEQPVALLEEVSIRMVLGVAVGYPFHGATGVEGEALGLLDGLGQPLAVVEDLLTDAFQGLGVGHVHPRAEHVSAEVVLRLSWLYLEVIAAEHRLLAAFAHEHPEMGLVRPLVRRKTGVAIKTVGAVLEHQALHVGIELCHALDDLLSDGVELRLGALVFLFVLMKPFAVVVVEHVGEKGDDFFHDDCKYTFFFCFAITDRDIPNLCRDGLECPDIKHRIQRQQHPIPQHLS